MRRRLLLLPLLVLCACASAAGTAPAATVPPTVILLVRHGEKEKGEDPALSAAGKARAQALMHAAGSAGLSAVYSTPTRRTQETAQPLAQRLGLRVTVREAGADQAKTFVQEVLRAHPGQAVLVVGHSNTLPALAEALTGQPFPAIADDEYDRLLVVTVPAAGPARLVALRYGAPSAR
jgi:broad specificity phosphatase PhoE